MPKPTTFTEELADAICERIADGESLRSVCRDPMMPTKALVLRWAGLNPAFADQYARARDALADTLVDDMLDIADDESLDPNARRVRLEMRKWIAAKMKPKKYGEKVEHTGSFTVNLESDATKL